MVHDPVCTVFIAMPHRLLQETMYRLKAYGVKSTLLIFGSARAKSKEQYEARLQELTAQVRESRERAWLQHPCHLPTFSLFQPFM